MKANKTKFKTRFVAMVLAVITLVSVCSVMATVNVSAATTTSASKQREMNGFTPTIINDGINNLVTAAASGNPYVAGVKTLSALFSIYLKTTSTEPTTQDVMDKLDELSSQLTDYFNSEKALLDKIDLKIDEKQFKDAMNNLMLSNENAINAIKDILDDENFPELETLETETLQKSTPDEVNNMYDQETYKKSKEDRQRDIYNQIVNNTLNNSQFMSSMDVVGQGISGRSLYGNAFDLYLKELKVSNQDSRTVQDQYHRFVELCTGQYILAYVLRTTGYVAQNKLYVLDDNQAGITSLSSMANQQWHYLQTVNNCYTSALTTEKCIEKCTVTKDGETKYYHSFADAWVEATQSSQSTLTLSQDLQLKKGESFMDDACFHQGDSKCFDNGSLYVNNSSLNLTLDLNGYKLTREGADYTIVIKETPVTIKNGTLDSVKTETKNTPLSNSLHLDNVIFSGQKGNGVNINLACTYVNYCTFTGYTNSAIYDMYGNLTVKNCKFKDNKTNSKGGAIYLKNDKVDITSSEFTNNNASDKGGAVACEGSSLNINNSTFDKNSSNTGGAVYSDLTANIQNSTFTNNKANGNGGALMFDYFGYDFTSDVKLTNVKLSNNTAGNNGGAVYFDSMTYATLTDVTARNNTCGRDGGGVYCQKGTGSACDPDLYGLINITDNHNNSGTNSNLFLGENTTSKCIVHCHDMSKNSRIGVTSPTSDSDLDITGKESSDFSSVFSYDTGKYHTHGYKGFWSGYYVEIVKN